MMAGTNDHADFEPLLDAESAGLENQLLLLEIQVVRGQLRAAQRELAGQRSKPSVPAGSVVITDEHYQTLREARGNLRWLLGKLGRGPIGLIVRRTSGYRKLADRWLAS